MWRCCVCQDMLYGANPAPVKNFDRPSTPQTWSGAKLCPNVFQTIPVNSIFGDNFFFSTIVFRVGHRFSSFWASFGASTGKRTSPSTSPQFFALDAAIMRSVRPKIDEKLAVGACTGGGRERTLHDRGFRAVVGRGRGGELTLTHQTPRGRWMTGRAGTAKGVSLPYLNLIGEGV